MKIFRLALKGSGTIRSMNSSISKTSRINTCCRTVSAWGFGASASEGTTHESVVERHVDSCGEASASVCQEMRW